MNIVLIADKNYIMPTSIVIASILQSNAKENLHFYIITQKPFINIINSSLQSFIESHKNHATLEIFTIENTDIIDFPIREGDHVSVAAYFRIFLPKLLPSIEKVLYIDGDTLCVDSLKEFYDTDLTEYSCAVVHDENDANKSYFNRLNYNSENGYFNSGVMLINLDWWRKNNVMQKCLDYITAEPDACIWHDQDVLNHVLNGSVLWIDFRYNYMQGFYFDKSDMCINTKYYNKIDIARNSPCIIHFSSMYKPWHVECNHPLKKKYRDFYREYTGHKLKLTYKLHGLAKLKWHIKKIIHKTHIKRYADFRQAIP